MTNWIEKYQAGKIFLQPNSSKLPSGYKIPYKNRSSELAISIGGENGEPAYLIPSFKYGIPLSNPIKEFNKTREHLGGPFKTWQEADKWEREIRHPYVEKGQPIPSPLKYWGEGFQEGGTIPKAQEGVKIQADRRNWLQRTNDRIQTAYNKNKPQLFKDFPITDIPGMVVEYVTGHSKDPDAGLAMVNPVGKVGRIKAFSSTDGKIKLLRNEKGEVDFLSSGDWQDAIRTASKNIRTYFGDSKYKNIVEKNQALSNRLKINQAPLPIERVHNLPLQESRLAQQSHLIGIEDPRPLEAAIINGKTKVAATYSRNLAGEGKITIPRIFSKEQTIRSAEHELLHHTYPNLGEGYPSFTQLETDKIKRVFKPSKELRTLEQSSDIPLWYLDEVDELVPNTFDMANDLGISKFQPYIGYKNFKPVLDNYKGYKSFIKDAMKLDSPRDYKRAWDLMTGVRVGTIPAVLGGTAAVANKNNFVEKRQKGGIINKWMYKNMNPTMAQEGASIRSDDRNWLERFNDKVYSGYQKHKPQLFKDFPITDLPGMMVEYITGHSDPETGLAMVNPVGKIGKAVKVHQAAGKFKAKEKGINFVKNWIEHPESQRRISEITDLSYAETFNQALKKTIKENPTYKPSFILDWLKDKASSLGVGSEFRKSFYILGPESFTTKNLNRGYLIPQSRIVKKEPGVTSRATGISFNDGSFWVARESPRSRITTDAVHEAAHNVTSNLENAKMKKITNDAFGGTNSIKKLKKANPGIAEEISYLTSPTEVYARVMELRKQFGLKPGQIVDKKLGEKIFTKGVLNKTEVSPTFFNLMGATRQYLPKQGGVWFTDLFNKLPATVPIGIVGSSMYMNNQNKDKE